MLKKIFLTTALTFGLSQAALSQEFDPNSGSLSVSGEATITLPNTAARVSFGIETQAQKSSDAVNQNSALLENVFQKMSEAGVGIEDIQTSNINLHPYHHRNSNTIEGYRMSNIVSVYVEDISSLGDVLGAATEAGINQINSVVMVPDQDAIDYSDLRRIAAKDAKEKADLYAEALGLEIIGILSIAEPGGRPGPVYAAEMAMAKSASVPIAAGDSGISSRVNVTYLVKLAD